MAAGSSDTSHLYDGKTVRSAPPSRKKAAGSVKGGSEVPDDAIPEVHIPGFVESLMGGPLVPKQKFLPPDRMVQTLQLVATGAVLVLGILTYVVNPVNGTMWHWVMAGSVLDDWNLPILFHVIVVAFGMASGLLGIFRRDPRWLLASYVLFLLVALRFASSKVEFSSDLFGGEIAQKVLIILYAVAFVLHVEISNGVIRFSMLDTSIRTNEVYVMNVKRILGKYRIALILNPVIAAAVAFFALLFNLIIPGFFGWFSDVTANRLEESVELTSVYGVALGTLIVFIVVGILFWVNVPLRIQQWRENQ